MITDVEPPANLATAIYHEINRLEKRQGRFRFFRELAISTISFASLVPLGLYFYTSLQTSGFNQYASLAISDSTYFLNQWYEFSGLLIESLPAFELINCVVIVIIFSWSTKNLIRRTR